MSPIQVLDRGRGPELAGTRITIFDILPLLKEGWIDASIGMVHGLSSAQVAALRAYFEANREEVLAAEAKILERIARGNPPEVEAKRAGSRAKLQALREQLQRQREQEANGAGHPE